MLARLVSGLGAAAGAAAGAQFPGFYAQYVQHISGRLSQARADLAPVARDAAARGLSVPDYLDRAQREGGELTGTLVEGYRTASEALQRLEAAYTALRAAGPLERPFALARHFHGEAAHGVLQDFRPTLPLTAEGLSYAAAGLLLGISAAWCGERSWQRWRRRMRGRRRDAQRGQHAQHGQHGEET